MRKNHTICRRTKSKSPAPHLTHHLLLVQSTQGAVNTTKNILAKLYWRSFYNVVYSTVDTFINLFSKLQTAFSYDVICLIFLFAYKKEICAINSRLKIFFLPICCVSQIKLNLSLAIESAHFYGFREPESSNQFLLKNHAVYCTHYVGF